MKLVWFHHPLLTGCLLLIVLAGCGIEVAQPATTPTTGPTAVGALIPSTADRAGAHFFAVDSLVRSTQLAGVDMHVRYVERSAAGLIFHLAFYNNSMSDLAFVQGAPATAAQLVGTATLTPTVVSNSLSTGIAPPGTWQANGANNGTLTFPATTDTSLSFIFPGFPPVAIRLAVPLREAPEPPQAADGHFRWAFEAAAIPPATTILRLGDIDLRADQLEIEVTVLNRDQASGSPPPPPRDAVVFDGRWNQLRLQATAPVTTAGADATGTTALHFPRPVLGQQVLLHIAGYPLILIPLQQSDGPRLALPSDLPPAVVPRPTPTATPKEAPADDERTARGAAQHVLDQLTAAVAQHDRAAYLAVWSSSAATEQSQLFDRLTSLPLQNVEWTVGSESGQSSFDAVHHELKNVPVTLRSTIRDVDPANVFVNDLHMNLSYDTTWRINDLAGDLPFWMVGPTNAERVGPFWIFFRPSAQPELTQLAEEARRAFGRVEQALPGRAKAVNVMFVTATSEEFTALTERPGDRFAGVALSRYQVSNAGIMITNQAFFLNGAAFTNAERGIREQTITHEFTHLVLAPTTMPFQPGWLVEGTAMAVAEDLPRDTMHSWLGSHRPTDMHLLDFSAQTSFGQGDDNEQTLFQYAYAAYLAKYIIQSYGMERYLALYDSYSPTPLPTIQAALGPTVNADERNTALGHLAQELTPTNVKATLGVEFADVEQGFDDWLVKQP